MIRKLVQRCGHFRRLVSVEIYRSADARLLKADTERTTQFRSGVRAAVKVVGTHGEAGKSRQEGGNSVSHEGRTVTRRPTVLYRFKPLRSAR